MICILTLRIDSASQIFFDELRRLHYPTVRNHTQAHLTMFHQLPGSEDVLESLDSAAKAQSPFQLKLAGLRALGGGVAYILESTALTDLHHRLVAALREHLIPQDSQRFMPHITVQNKVTSDEARTLLARLQARPGPSAIKGCGLDLWEYMGGPWRYLRTFEFAA